MAILTFDLTDSNGVPAKIGDEINVIYPEIDITNGEDWYYRPQVTARARILMPPSKGLRLRILEILHVLNYDDDDDEYYDSLDVGQLTGFRRTVWHWEKVDNETPPPIESNLIWFNDGDYAKTDKSGSITICINGEPITLQPEQWHKIARESSNA